ncbi:MAG TPA: hypothetical protein VMY37_28565, partial [Thermoguttaceae bacterium]|nr:hypothetical protein [Thermoguttaceae bacterium]
DVLQGPEDGDDFVAAVEIEANVEDRLTIKPLLGIERFSHGSRSSKNGMCLHYCPVSWTDFAGKRSHLREAFFRKSPKNQGRNAFSDGHELRKTLPMSGLLPTENVLHHYVQSRQSGAKTIRTAGMAICIPKIPPAFNRSPQFRLSIVAPCRIEHGRQLAAAPAAAFLDTVTSRRPHAATTYEGYYPLQIP